MLLKTFNPLRLGIYIYLRVLLKIYRKSPKEKLKEITDLFKVRELYELIPFMCFTGCGVAFYAGFLHSLVERSLGEGIEESEVNTKTTYVFLCLGVSEIISGTH